MNIFVSREHQKKTASVALSAAAVITLMLSGCGQNESKDNADSSSSSSASTNASNDNTAAPSAANPETKSEGDENAPAENYAGSEALASASAVDLSQEQVAKTNDLYTSYEGLLANVGTVEQPAGSEADEATSGEEDGTNKPNLILDETTEQKINEVATASAGDEFAANALEFGTNGWKQEGTSKIVGEPKIADTEFDGKPAKILEVCIDSSDVTVKDSAGNALTSSNAPKRSLNIFTLIEDNGNWKIASHDFPNNPDC